MSTTPNIRIIGEETPAPKKLKPIELYKLWAGPDQLRDVGIEKPEHYQNIELIARDYFSMHRNYDLIFCYNSNRSEGVIFIGHWNDGVAN